MPGPAPPPASGWSASSSAVTTPKEPPPPRSAQSSSAFSSSAARTRRPSQVTSSAATRLSQARPCRRSSQPEPPPSVRPATPVLETRPPVVARPWSAVARSTCAQMAPPPTRAMRRPGWTSTADIRAGRARRRRRRASGPRPVASGPHGEGQALLAREGDCRDDIVDGHALGHVARPALDHRVEQGAGVLVVGITRFVQAPVEPETQFTVAAMYR